MRIDHLKFLAVAAAAGLITACRHAPSPRAPRAVHHAANADTVATRLPPDDVKSRAAADPATFLRFCRDRCRENVRDFVCLFVKEERLADGLSPERHMLVRFLEDPYSVDLTWTKNPQLASRMTYVKGWQDRGGNPIARFHLRGGLALIAPRGVYRCIYADGIGTESRRPVDCFGLCHMLDMIVATNDHAAGHPGFELLFLGADAIDQRPTLCFRRRLPYPDEPGDWPDRLMILHLDAEELVPIALYAYADDDASQLLARYEFRNLRCNVGVSPEEFGPPPPNHLTPDETDHRPGAMVSP